MEHTTMSINIIVYGIDETEARNIAHSVIGNNEEKGVYISNENGTTLRGYIRFVNGSSYTIPQGVTDIIIVHVGSSSDSYYATLQKYLKERETVPVRLIYSSDESVNQWAIQENIISLSDISSIKDTVLTKLHDFRENLNNHFNKHTATQSLDETQFNAVLNELLPETVTEAGIRSNLSYLFDHDSLLTFDLFYKWWIMGRNDEEYYKGISDMIREYKCTAAKMIPKFLIDFKNDSASEYHGKIDISPVTEFVHGFKIGLETKFGEEYDKIAHSFSNSQQASPFTASFEVGVQDESKVQEMINKLNELKDMAKENIKVLGYLLRSGLDIQFRSANNRFHIDAVVSGLFGEMINNFFKLSGLNLEKFHFTLNSNLSVSTGFSPMSLLNKFIEEILKNAMSVSIQGTNDCVNVRTIISGINFILNLIDAKTHYKQNVNMVLTGLAILKSVGFELKYDSHDLFNTVAEIVASKTSSTISSDPIENLQVLSHEFSSKQESFKMIVEQGKQMIKLVADYMELIKNLQLDRITYSFSSSLMKAYINAYVEIPSVTDFLNQTFLQ